MGQLSLIISLSLNIASIAFLIHKRHYILSLLIVVFAILHTAQAFLMFTDFETSNVNVYLNNVVSKSGYASSLLYLFLISFFILVFSGFIPRHCPVFINIRTPRFLRFRFLFIYLLLLLSILWLISSVGGVNTFLYSSRPAAIGGATLPLVFLSVGIFPLLISRLLDQKITLNAKVSFVLSMIITLLVSKINFFAYCITSFLVFSNFTDFKRIFPAMSSGTLSDLPALSTNRIRRNPSTSILKTLSFAIVILSLLFFAGYYRDSLNSSHSSALGLDFENARQNVFQDISLFYNVAIEGQSSIAGAFTLSENTTTLTDFGLTLVMKSLYQLTPSALKASFVGLVDLNQFYWYKLAIVPSSACDLLMAFGWLGSFLFPVLLFWIYRSLLYFYYSSSSIFLKYSFAIQIGLLIFLVRGSLFIYISFALAYFLICLFLSSLLRIRL